ncbi:MAG: GTPase Era [Firmicutes bacterium]|nr:GTPase Era [Bacillota bacterium]
MKSGFVGLVGRPNVGKSTLMNHVLERHIAITSNKPQTTRNMIHGIYNDDDSQIVFVDTPGIHKPNHKLGNYLNKEAYYSMDDVDLLLFLTDASEPLGPGDKYIIERLKQVDKPVFLILNKIDKLKKDQIMAKIQEYMELYSFQEIIPVSALKDDNLETLLKVIKSYLKEGVCYYGKEDVTNKTTEFVLSEMIREKVFRLTEEEVPHSVACYIESIETKKNSKTIYANIIVDRDSVKRIIVGANGQMIKKIGTYARADMEEMLGTKVYLNLFVKVIKNWRDKEKYLKEFGYQEFE